MLEDPQSPCCVLSGSCRNILLHSTFMGIRLGYSLPQKWIATLAAYVWLQASTTDIHVTLRQGDMTIRQGWRRCLTPRRKQKTRRDLQQWQSSSPQRALPLALQVAKADIGAMPCSLMTRLIGLLILLSVLQPFVAVVSVVVAHGFHLHSIPYPCVSPSLALSLLVITILNAMQPNRRILRFPCIFVRLHDETSTLNCLQKLHIKQCREEFHSHPIEMKESKEEFSINQWVLERKVFTQMISGRMSC